MGKLKSTSEETTGASRGRQHCSVLRTIHAAWPDLDDDDRQYLDDALAHRIDVGTRPLMRGLKAVDIHVSIGALSSHLTKACSCKTEKLPWAN